MDNVIIGIDIGGTNTEVGVIKPNGEIIKRDKMPTRKHGADFNAYLADLVELINSAVKTCGNVKLAGIGIRLPMGIICTEQSSKPQTLNGKKLCQFVN